MGSCPFMLTSIVPSEALKGTIQYIIFPLLPITLAGKPPIFTFISSVLLPKLFPWIYNLVRAPPSVGSKPVI